MMSATSVESVLKTRSQKEDRRLGKFIPSTPSAYLAVKNQKSVKIRVIRGKRQQSELSSQGVVEKKRGSRNRSQPRQPANCESTWTKSRGETKTEDRRLEPEIPSL